MEKIKGKVLLVVPHQDDELFVGGGLLKVFAQSEEYKTHVIFTTNGDFFPEEGEVRLRESLHILTKLYHIEESHIFFLGYGDGWKSDRHLYNHMGWQIIESMAGRRETYGIAEHEDFRQAKSGRHSAYCRDSFKKDLKELMGDIAADILIAVDYDKHPDHKAASLMVEECIGELLREREDYRPIVLKRYAYDGVWKGKADFFDIPRKRTILSHTESSPYGAEDQICIAMPPECSTPCLRHNFLYAAAKCYRTEEVWQKADEIINIDEVYFKRRTDNLLYTAQLEPSSGNAEYIRDFKLFDCGDVLKRELILKECAWMPETLDSVKKIHIHLQSPKKVERINIYALGDSEEDVMEGEFVFGNGMHFPTGTLKLNGKKNILLLETQENIQDIDFYLTKCVGNPMGITEMEILPSSNQELPEMLQEMFFEDDTLEDTASVRRMMEKERKQLLFKRKISQWFPNEYFLRRHYSKDCRKDSFLMVDRIKYVAERFGNKLYR